MVAVVAMLCGCVAAPAEETSCAPTRTAYYQPPVTLGGAGQVRVVETDQICAAAAAAQPVAAGGDR